MFEQTFDLAKREKNRTICGWKTSSCKIVFGAEFETTYRSGFKSRLIIAFFIRERGSECIPRGFCVCQSDWFVIGRCIHARELQFAAIYEDFDGNLVVGEQLRFNRRRVWFQVQGQDERSTIVTEYFNYWCLGANYTPQKCHRKIYHASRFPLIEENFLTLVIVRYGNRESKSLFLFYTQIPISRFCEIYSNYASCKSAWNVLFFNCNQFFDFYFFSHRPWSNRYYRWITTK